MMDIEELLEKAISNYQGNNQAILDEVLAGLPPEPWDDIKRGDPRAKNAEIREDYRYKSEKWAFARHFVNDLQSDTCEICRKPLHERFDLHHKDNGRGHYFDLKLSNLEAIHRGCHRHKHGDSIKKAIKKLHTKLTGDKKMNEAIKFTKFVRSLKNTNINEIFKTAAIEELCKHLSFEKSFITISISLLNNMGFFVRVNRGEVKITNEFVSLLKRSDEEIGKLFSVYKEESAPYGNLPVQRKKNQTMSFARINHPNIEKYISSIGLEISNLLKNSEKFRDMKAKNHARICPSEPPKSVSPIASDPVYCKAEPLRSPKSFDYGKYFHGKLKELLDEKAKTIVDSL
jgi:hypothetical protein